MLQGKREKLEKLGKLIRDYSVLFGESIVLESPLDMFYVSDPETHVLHYAIMKSADHPAFQNYEGKKCYAVLQGRDTPCPFCTNSLLSSDRHLVWEHFNPVVKRNFLIRDRIVEVGGKRLRLEVAQDVTDQERAKKILLDTVIQQNLLTHWMKHFVEHHDPGMEFSPILRDLMDYFKAGSGFIRLLYAAETAEEFPDGRERFWKTLFLEDCPESELTAWIEELLEGKKFVLIPSAGEIREKDPESYDFLTGYGVDNLCLAPIFCEDRLVGMIGLENIKANMAGLPLLEMLGDCIAASVQKLAMQEEKRRILYMDPLTGFLNFEGYKLQAGRCLQENPDKNYALCYCDIKKFKFVNELCGYQVGDSLLKYWMEFLAKNMRECESFCRISGDTVSVLRYYDDPEEIRWCFEEASKHLMDFPELVQKRLRLEMAAGIYLIPKENRHLPIGEILSRAAMAQKIAKANPGSGVAFYDEEMRRKEIREMAFIANMHEALKNEEFCLYLQPQIGAGSHPADKIRAEVLVRWRQNDQIVAMPGEFIGLFERNGFIVDLDHYMFECACRYLDQTGRKLKKQMILSVNVSRITMVQPNFVRDYVDIKERYKIADGSIELEFTENVVVEDLELFSELIHNLKSHGFLCAMDDFGAGQSSLNVLQALPLDVLKLDQMFFRDRKNEQRKSIIVASILQMAKNLNMLTVAEGIETESQMRELTEMGCDYIQGYYYSKPLPVEEFEEKYLGTSPEQ